MRTADNPIAKTLQHALRRAR